jgi:uncharacterized membrane protein YjjP (DUF1212 family)
LAAGSAFAKPTSGHDQAMPDIEEVKAEFNRLDGVDKRWVIVCGVVAVAALVSAALAGSLFGDLIAFILTFTAGWVVHAQWNVIRRPRRKTATPRTRTRTRKRANSA